MTHKKFPAPPCPEGFLYTVRRGDTMFKIARRFGIPLQTLIAANPQVPNPNLIFPGQQLCVPVKPAPPVCPGFLYTVRRTDTLFLIAQRFGVSLADLIAANPQIKNPDLIFPGQVICVPVKVKDDKKHDRRRDKWDDMDDESPPVNPDGSLG